MTLALPLLDSMIPAQTPLGKTGGAVPRRASPASLFPHGVRPDGGSRKRAARVSQNREPGDKDFKYPMILKPLEPFRDQTVILSGLWSKSAEPPPGATGADHWVAAAFLCANKPKKTTGADIYDGTTIDQIIAQKIGQETLLPSLQLALEDPGANSSNCGEGYSCAYTNSISWATPTQPLPMELDPQVVFERLFGDGGTPAERAARREQDRSILDSVTEKLARFKKDLGAERPGAAGRILRPISARSNAAWTSPRKPSARYRPMALSSRPGVPESFDEHVKLHFDLQTLAFQADITRVSTVLYARDLTARILSRKRRQRRLPWRVASRRKSGQHRELREAQSVSRQVPGVFHRQTEETPDGDGTLLDHSLILYGTNMGDSNQHLHYDVPHLLIGGASGQLKGNRHLAYPTKSVTSGNLLLSILDMYGIHQDASAIARASEGLI